MTSDKETSLLGHQFLRELEALSRRLQIRTTSRGAGAAPGRRHGSSAEFSDHRGYVPGDDPQRIDWAAYARSGETVIKRFRSEEDVIMRIVLDASTSMISGAESKLPTAQRIAAALSYVGLSRGLRVQLYAAGGTMAGASDGVAGPVRRGRGQIGPSLRSIAAIEAGGSATLSSVVQYAMRRADCPGWLVVVSDLLDDTDLERALTYLRLRRHDVALCHVTDPADFSPDFEGDTLIVDSESGETLELTVDADALHALQVAWRERADSFRSWARKHGSGYTVATPTTPLPATIERIVTHTID